MTALFNFWENPAPSELYMIAGWHGWADAGNISSGLPHYLIDHLNARKIGELAPDGFYLFQVPGTHHFLRPEVKLEDGLVKGMEKRVNEFFYAETGPKGLVIFLGEEPHLDADRYADAFLEAVESLGVRRVVALGGVYGSMPYDKERELSCVFSKWHMKDELESYALRFSDYEGGATIGTVLVDRAGSRGLEFVDFYAFVPAYDFSEVSDTVQGLRIDSDYRAWYEIMRRLNHMWDLAVDLTDLEQQGDDLVRSIEAKIDELDRRMPQLKVKAYMERLSEDFTERSFMPLDDLWEDALEDVLDDLEG